MVRYVLIPLGAIVVKYRIRTTILLSIRKIFLLFIFFTVFTYFDIGIF